MKKKLILISILCVLMVCPAVAQVEYHATKVSLRKWNELTKTSTKAPFQRVSTQTVITIYNNAITIRGDRDFSLKFVRKSTFIDEDGATQLIWNAVDLQGKDPCRVIMVDYGTYSKIAFHWLDSGTFLIYETL
ncbi:MAG: hypothetical protein B7X86_14320 [Sphingobacteriales bacterium 17-39-43]|uniref:hypothetical protein n=1 Tax=Daejeonella sp. TaxID=2805397 RepID=UPI000BCDEEED|nr:hypothetical protein [Daejeonella sp.]OYZ30123.1 MAG: hypothetical protein B7Y24_14085 [Sphingobacteriales bacterium 16-39-50]OZA22841.1 MAG: hypothetical protein B7X86_14320 [Sphingobacteriales bacterium 17-39-43]HQT24007.1 hypothetical protein [Daejeonella sp.]HQT58671.1 hypothetical protein [Daejeonella sp.]